MSFFELPPRPPEAEEPDVVREPAWIGPPRNVLGAAVPVRLVLARTTDLVIAVIGATAYPTGFEFEASLRTRRVSEADADLAMMWHPRMRKGEIPPEFLRLGVEFSDGAKATNLRQPWFAANPGEPPSHPVLMARSGSGSGANWDQRYWVWPLPPAGPFAFVCEWPAEGIPLTRAEIDGASIRAAADQAELLWDEEPGDATGSSWSAY